MLGAEHKDTLKSLNNMGVVLMQMKDYEEAQDYCQQALSGYERVLGKTLPLTMFTIRIMGFNFFGLQDFTKADEMQKLELDGHEKSTWEGTRGHVGVRDAPGVGIVHPSSYLGNRKTQKTYRRLPTYTHARRSRCGGSFFDFGYVLIRESHESCREWSGLCVARGW